MIQFPLCLCGVRPLYEKIVNTTTMSIPEQIQKDIVEAMRARQEHRLSTLRMLKSALRSKEIDKRAPLDEKQAVAIINTLLNHRKSPNDQITPPRRPHIA